MLHKINLVKCQSADYLLFDTNDAITQHLKRNGSWETHLVAISRLFTHGIQSPVVLDVGANLGAYAIPLAKELAASGGLIYAFEPQRIVYYQLCGNIFLNRLDNVFAFWMAIGHEDGSITLPGIDYQKTENVGGFSLVEQIRNQTDCVALTQTIEPVKTPLRRLSSVGLPDIISLMKIDVEGYDLNVLSGATDVIEHSHFPPLLFEAWGFDWFKERKEELFAFIKSMGYIITPIFGDDYVAQHPQHPVHIDFVTDGQGRFKMTRTR